MTTDDRLLRRWVGVALGATMILSACGSSTADDAAAEVEAPSELALDAAEVETVDPDAAVTDDFESLEDLEGVELTPEMFEDLKTDEVSRAAILEEMQTQGLDAEEAECFLDTVSPGLFITFGAGAQPDDEQFAELLGLLDTCEIAFGAES